jgi:lipopolysaccharide/colanic/teichoic acid biosynthesis glycosyltransferase
MEKLGLESLNYSEEQLFRRYAGFYNRIIKRGIDFAIALTAFVLLFPVYIVICILIALDSGFPVMYRPERGGYKGKKFRIFKFRTMIQNADQVGGGTTALNDPRITKVGAFLRKTKLDEFPQLLNVISGKMSFVGPRPELLSYTQQYRGIDKNILNVRPGITDFSSLTFINLDEIVGQDNPDYVYETLVLPCKNKLRLKYVAEVSLVTDVKLFMITISKVFQKAKRFLVTSKTKGTQMGQ